MYFWRSAVVLATVFLSSSAVPDQAASSLRYVFACFRHGIRSPLTQWPMDQDKDMFLKLYSGVPGGLTTVGINQMYKVGKTLKQRYGEFVGEFREDRVRVSSTGVSRTIKSALSVMAGMFPPAEPFSSIPWQPIPVWQGTEDWDKFMVFDLNEFTLSKGCPKYVNLLGDLVEKMNSPPKVGEGKRTASGYDLQQTLITFLQERSGNRNIKSLVDMQKVYDVLNSAKLNGLPLPSWATTKYPEFGYKALYPDLLKADIETILNKHLTRSQINDVFNFQTGTMFWYINSRLREKTSNMASAERMRYHQTHDISLIPLLLAMGLRAPVGPGDGVIFELHDQGGRSEVKIFYYDAGNGHVVKELKSPFCPPPCSVSQFSSMFPGISPDAWKQTCE